MKGLYGFIEKALEKQGIKVETADNAMVRTQLDKEGVSEMDANILIDGESYYKGCVSECENKLELIREELNTLRSKEEALNLVVTTLQNENEKLRSFANLIKDTLHYYGKDFLSNLDEYDRTKIRQAIDNL